MLAASDCVVLKFDKEQLTNASSGGRAGREGPLLALADQGLSARFHRWRGASGQRYVFTIFASREEAAAFASAIVIAVSRDMCGVRTVVGIGATGADGQISDDTAGLSCGAGTCEWHVHLMAATPNARRNVMVDLQALLQPDDGSAMKCA